MPKKENTGIIEETRGKSVRLSYFYWWDTESEKHSQKWRETKELQKMGDSHHPANVNHTLMVSDDFFQKFIATK